MASRGRGAERRAESQELLGRCAGGRELGAGERVCRRVCAVFAGCAQAARAARLKQLERLGAVLYSNVQEHGGGAAGEARVSATREGLIVVELRTRRGCLGWSSRQDEGCALSDTRG